MSYDDELAEFRQLLDNAPVVGHPLPREQELITLAQLIERYPADAREMLQHHDEAHARGDAAP